MTAKQLEIPEDNREFTCVSQEGEQYHHCGIGRMVTVLVELIACFYTMQSVKSWIR